MAKMRAFPSFVIEETAHLVWFEAFMRGRCGEPSCCAHPVLHTKSIIRIELEQQTYAESDIFHEPATDCPERISGLQALLEDAPPLPGRKLLWHRALEELLDGTRDGLEDPQAIEIRD